MDEKQVHAAIAEDMRQVKVASALALSTSGDAYDEAHLSLDDESMEDAFHYANLHGRLTLLWDMANAILKEVEDERPSDA